MICIHWIFLCKAYKNTQFYEGETLTMHIMDPNKYSADVPFVICPAQETWLIIAHLHPPLKWALLYSATLVTSTAKKMSWWALLYLQSWNAMCLPLICNVDKLVIHKQHDLQNKKCLLRNIKTHHIIDVIILTASHGVSTTSTSARPERPPLIPFPATSCRSKTDSHLWKHSSSE